MTVQLPLGLRLRPEATFEGFVPGRNAEALRWMQEAAGRGVPETDDEGSGLHPPALKTLYLWGGTGTGKTHLLHAACRAASDRGVSSVYVPLARIDELDPAVLEGLERLTLVCLDDVQFIAGRGAWERGVFTLFNAVRDHPGSLLVAGSGPPGSIGIGLPDLATRLAWGLVLQLQPLGDDELQLALVRRARALGIDLPEEVARFMVQRFARDTTSLFRLLDGLDRESLAAQRRLTVPFLQSVIDRLQRIP
jgi:DnaA family protein